MTSDYYIISNLPIEIWVLISKYLHKYDRALCRLICKSWKDAFDNKFMWDDIKHREFVCISLQSLKWNYYVRDYIKYITYNHIYISRFIRFNNVSVSLWLVNKLIIDNYAFITDKLVLNDIFKVLCMNHKYIEIIKLLCEFHDTNFEVIHNNLRILLFNQLLLLYACKTNLSSVKWVMKKFKNIDIHRLIFAEALKRSHVLALIIYHEYIPKNKNMNYVIPCIHKVQLVDIIWFIEIFNINRLELLAMYDYDSSNVYKIVGLLKYIKITSSDIAISYIYNNPLFVKLAKRAIKAESLSLLEYVYKKIGHNIFHSNKSICFGYMIFRCKKRFTRKAINITHLSKYNIYNSLITKSSRYMHKNATKRAINYCGLSNVPKNVIESIKTGSATNLFNDNRKLCKWVMGRFKYINGF